MVASTLLEQVDVVVEALLVVDVRVVVVVLAWVLVGVVLLKQLQPFWSSATVTPGIGDLTRPLRER